MNDSMLLLDSLEYQENLRKFQAPRRYCEHPKCKARDAPLSKYNADIFCEACKTRLVKENPQYTRPAQRFCRAGHDKWKKGTNVRGECKECIRIRREEPRIDRSKRAGERRFPLHGLRAAKERSFLSYRDLARDLSVDPKTVQNYALLRCWCNERNARQLAESLGVSFEELKGEQ